MVIKKFLYCLAFIFCMNRFVCFSLFLFLLVFTTGCSSPETLQIGILSDVQGDTETLGFILDEFSDVDAVFFLGDANEYRNAVDDREEIDAVFDVLTALDVPVYVLPGNHEVKEDYYAALEGTDLIDLSSSGFFDYDGFDVISVPGYHRPNFPAVDGFVFETVDTVKQKKDPLLMLAHGPPSGMGLDKTLTKKNVGSDVLSDFISSNDVSFGFFGHIHESGGAAVGVDGERVLENVWTDSLFLNVGSVVPWPLISGKRSQGMAAIVELDPYREYIRYSMVRLE